ncbi:thiol reductant ABC exporter subunit CydC [Streptococcus saliviloxodontae]|uniref:ATP-binding cassette subfamily C protein CydC n=1 Tax=Streptococcus saliviloxodontae TaxID=1349416 RepID=A0ABS2PK57_9STRE|nr:thiol reductant ABC exporter subunit CydC [Streptococcus saliviloxodontae]MBM7635652.1 ATP-binding cassette subfamily C protein CydC [Streptococcus saliviloxodontae]
MTKLAIIQLLKKDKWVLPYFKRYKVALVTALALGFLTFFCSVALMFNSGFLISKSASLPSNILLVYIPIVLTRTFGIGRPLFRYLERLTSHHWVLKMTSSLRKRLYLALEQDAVFLKNRVRLGDIMGILSQDINYLQNLYLRTIFPTIIAWICYFCIIVLLGFVSLSFALLVSGYLLIVLLVVPFLSLSINGERETQMKEMKAELYRDVTDNVLGVSDWIFSQRGKDYVTKHEESEAKLQEIQSKVKRFNNRRAFLTDAFFGILVLFVLIWSSSTFHGNHGGSANWIAAFVLAVFPISEIFSGLATASQEVTTYSDSIRRLNDLPQTTDATSNHLEVPERFDLMINELSFSYEHKSVLNQLSLVIPQGQKLAILGPSGSGKSTLLTLIRGDLAPQEGSVLIDGHKISDFGETISDMISVIQQSPYLFNTSILNNVRLGNEKASVEEVWSALEKVGLKEMVSSLPKGLETLVDEAGLRFSGGERHRMALARILLQDCPIVLLDEPTLGLDPITEMDLLDTVMKTLDGKTIIWVTHHLKGVSMVDQVIFLEKGKLTMSGSPQDLLQTNERYRQLKRIDDGEDTVSIS